MAGASGENPDSAGREAGAVGRAVAMAVTAPHLLRRASAVQSDAADRPTGRRTAGPCPFPRRAAFPYSGARRR
jgi:hypothetical protein